MQAVSFDEKRDGPPKRRIDSNAKVALRCCGLVFQGVHPARLDSFLRMVDVPVGQIRQVIYTPNHSLTHSTLHG
jgi:hypothetical protein